MDKLATVRGAPGQDSGKRLRHSDERGSKGCPDRARNYATMASGSRAGNLLNEATGFAEEALKRADDNERSSIAVVFARLAAINRRYESAYPRGSLLVMADVAANYYTPKKRRRSLRFLTKYKNVPAARESGCAGLSSWTSK